LSAVVLVGKLTKLEVGVDVNTHTDVTNLVYMRWNRIHEIRGAFVSATKTPDHWSQGHSWVAFEVGLLGYHTAFTTQSVDGSGNKAYDEDGDSYPIGYFVITYKDKTGASKTTTFDNAIIATMDLELRDTQDPITVVRGLAYFKTDA
jgi:hypothetical protein